MAFIDFLVLPGTVLNTLHKLAHMFFISNSYLACIQEKKKKKEPELWNVYVGLTQHKKEIPSKTNFLK